jgi:hypothetical protein
MNALTQQQINQYQWQAADGVARIVNPFDTDFTAGLHDKFELWFKENSFSTNAPDGIYSGEAFEIVWQTSSIAKDDWTNCIYQEAYTAYMQGRPFRLFLRLKPSYLPAVLTTQPGEEWNDRYREVWQWQDKDGAWCNSDFGPERKEYGLSFVRWSDRMIGYPTRITWHLNTPPAEQEAEMEPSSHSLMQKAQAYFDKNAEMFSKQAFYIAGYMQCEQDTQSTLAQKDQRIAQLEREWTSVEDKEPNAKTQIFIFDLRINEVLIIYFNGNINHKWFTHWMPLPTPPQH